MPQSNTDYKKWNFFKYQEGEKEKDSSSGKLFGDSNINESLIRELIQNSLDAVDDKNKPVRVAIKLKELEKNECLRYFEGMKRHYKASHGKDLIIGEKIKFLILEDFNTTGLENKKQDDFFRRDNIRSDNDSSSGGSHGIGKIIFYVASTIDTFFAYSVYKSGDIFEGTCVFKTHKIDEIKYKEDGSLKLCSGKDKSFIKDLFSRDENQKGLSIAIPLPKGYLDIEKLERAVIEEYYYPIIDDKLIVKLGKNEIDGSNILEQKGVKQKLVSSYITSSKKDFIIEIGEGYKSNATADEFFSMNEKEEMISRVKDNKYVSIRFKFAIQLKGKENQKGYLDFLIAEKEDDQAEKFDFWREALLIKDATRRKSRSSRYAVIVLIHGGSNELSKLLRQLENPSHTRWDHKDLSSDITDKYQSVPKLVTFVTQLPNKIIDIIKISDAQIDSAFFSGFFPDTSAVGGGPTEDKGTGEIGSGFEGFEDSVGNLNFIFRKNRKINGFNLSLSDAGKQEIGNQEEIFKVNITLAYGTNKGNPFKSYDVRDFDLTENTIGVEVENGEQIERKENKLTYQITDNNFKVSLSGFDPDRELKINVEEGKV